MRRIIVYGVVLAVLAAGCGDAGSRVTTITEDDAGTTVSIAVGDTLEIVLPANPSTGYTWEVVGEPRCITLQGTVLHTTNDELVGRAGLLTLDFEGVEAGSEDLTLVYQRPWETVAPERTYTVRLVVEA